jgi:hypothetical protein
MSDTRNGVDETDAASYAETAMRGRLDDLSELTKAAGYSGRGVIAVSAAKLEALGFDREGDPLNEQAERLLDEYPLCVEATTTFEIVLGTGGPDDRLLIECGAVGHHTVFGAGHTVESKKPVYEIRRVLYRYSWMGSAEVELVGEDRETAEELARHVVPELVE